MTLRTPRALALSAITAILLIATLLPIVPARAATATADFSADTVGEPPGGWTSRWAPGWFAVQDNPRRLVQGPSSSPRRLLSLDAVGTPASPEVRAIVQVPADNAATTRFQVHIAGAGEEGAETSYYVEQVSNGIRLGKLLDGSASTVSSTVNLDGGLVRGLWYELVLAEDAGTVTASMWPLGATPPASPMVTYVDPTPLAPGWVGIGSGSAGTNPAYADFAFFSVGSDADPAPPAVNVVAQAVAPTRTVTGVGVSHDWGFSTVTWSPNTQNAPLLTQYEIERAPVDANNVQTGPATLVGIWRYNRYTYTGESLTFADAGFIPGGRYAWRVRAVAAGVQGPWSTWALGTTQAPPSPSASLRTEWEGNPDDWTTYEGELAFTALLADSDRVRVELMGRTHLGREINLFVIGDPPGTEEAIREGSSVLLNCNVHGNEPSGREACFMVARYLAFSDDPFVTDLLEEVSVLVLPSMNGDGRAANSRGNAHGNQDLNRDHSLLREPENLAVARAISTYEPEVAIDGHHYGDTNVGDLPLLWARNEGVNASLAAYTQDVLTLDHLFGAAEGAGWWPQPYPIGYSEETILRNTMGLKSIVGVLLESRSSGGPTRPNTVSSGGAGVHNHNDRRHTYSHLWTYMELLRFTLESHDDVEAVQQAAYDANTANEGPLVLHGTRDTPRYNPPPRPSREGTVVDPAPCGYLITEQQYTERPLYDPNPEFGQMPSVQTRLAAHGIQVEETEDGIWIPLGQPMRNLIALILDPAAPGQQDDFGSYGSYQGAFLYSGQAERVMTCPVEPTPTPTPTPTVTPTPTPTPTVTPTPTPTPTQNPGNPGNPPVDPVEQPTEEPTPTPSPTPIPTPDPEPAIERLEGADRIQTAIAVSQEEFEDGEASNVLIARADQFADALAGTPLGAARNAPVLITGSDTLAPGVADEIARALTPGGTVYLLGGEAAIGAAVADALTEDGYLVERLAGASRVETAIAVAEEIGDPAGLLITTGDDFPDAMTAGAAAGANEGAVLLTPSGTPHPAVDAYLAAHDVDTWAIGGPAAAAYPDATPVVGATRQETAVAVAETFFAAPSAVGLARDDDFPDALAGGVVLALMDAPLLLTSSGELSQATLDWVTEQDGLTTALVFGGEQAISQTVFEALRDLLSPAR